MIDTSLAVEREGLKGRAWIDARWPHKAGDRPSDGTASYDYNLFELAQLLKDRTSIPTEIDMRDGLFQLGDCPDAALYVGWYSYGKYVDAFDWAPGAVGYHIASGEAGTMRGNRPQWCRSLLLDGCVATLGPVAEPYLYSFPQATDFFGLLLAGRHTLVECYYLSLPRLSWMMTLTGDPLYRPFAAHPALAEPPPPTPIGL
jgi:uncharacterized protein (TIGR03790 family)